MNETHEHIEDTQNESVEHAETDQQAQQEAQEHAARMESIRQLAVAGELETSDENEEIVEALVDTIRARDELSDKLLRMAADHQNFQRRASGNEREARTSATQGVVQSLIPLLDTFEMARGQIAFTVVTERELYRRLNALSFLNPTDSLLACQLADIGGSFPI